MVGLLIAGAIAAWAPDSFWRAFFFDGHPLAAKLWGPLVGPLVALASFVCSIGNVPLAVVLWQGGISFGGVVALIGRRPARRPAAVHRGRRHRARSALTASPGGGRSARAGAGEGEHP